jgi:hypothetical protein
VSCTEPWSLSLPNYTDKGGQPVEMSVDLGTVSEYLAYDETKNTISANIKKIQGIS